MLFINKNIENPWFSVVVIAIFALLFISPSFLGMAGLADHYYHTTINRFFAEQFYQGDFYPRWLIDANAGCGSAVFSFYPPLAYYLGLLFYPLKSVGEAHWMPIVASLYMFAVLAGMSCFALLKDITKDKIASLLAALAYLAMPYMVIVFHVHLHFSEVLIFSLIPLMLLAVRKMIVSDRWWLLFSLGLAMLFIASITGTIVNAGLPVLYALYVMYTRKLWHKSPWLLGAIALAFGLAAFYLLPMVMEKYQVYAGSSNDMWEGIFFYKNNFVFTLFPDNLTDIMFFPIFLMIVVSISVLIIYRLYKAIPAASPFKKEAMFWLCIIAGAVFMMSELSIPLWDLIPLLQVMQFPHRIMSIVVFSVTIMVGIYFSDKRMDRVWGCVCVAVLLLVSNLFSVAMKDVVIDKDALSASDKKAVENREILYAYNVVFHNDYLPSHVDKAILYPDAIEETAKECASKVTILSGGAEVAVKNWGWDGIALDVNATTESRLRISQFYYPNWQASDVEGRVYPLSYDQEFGLITLNVPKGQHHIALRFMPSDIEKTGRWISMVSLLVLLGGLGYNTKQKNMSIKS